MKTSPTIHADEVSLTPVVLIDCTAKAVTHRIAKFRKMAGAFNGGKKGAEAATEDADSDDGAEGSTPKSTKKGGKGGKGGKKRAVTEDADDQEDQVAKKMKAEERYGAGGFRCTLSTPSMLSQVDQSIVDTGNGTYAPIAQGQPQPYYGATTN